MDKFQFVEINGMKISEPNTAFSLLWQALSGQKSAPRQALTQLEAHFQTPDFNRKTTCVPSGVLPPANPQLTLLAASSSSTSWTR